MQPFNNYLVSLTLTGAQIYDVLTQQVTGANASSNKILQVSDGFSYQLGPNGPVDGTVELDEKPIDKAASYRIVTNNFLADGGDGFPAFRGGQARYFGGLDIDAFAAYLTGQLALHPGRAGPHPAVTSALPGHRPGSGRTTASARRPVRSGRVGVLRWRRTHVRTTVVCTGRGRDRFLHRAHLAGAGLSVPAPNV